MTDTTLTKERIETEIVIQMATNHPDTAFTPDDIRDVRHILDQHQPAPTDEERQKMVWWLDRDIEWNETDSYGAGEAKMQRKIRDFILSSPPKQVGRKAVETLAMDCWDIQVEINTRIFKWAYSDKDKIPLDYVTDAIVGWLKEQGITVEDSEENERLQAENADLRINISHEQDFINENAALKAELIEANKLAMAHFETSEKFAALIEDLRAELEEHRAELKLVANAVHDFYQGRGNVNTVLDRIHSIIVVSGMEDNARASKGGK